MKVLTPGDSLTRYQQAKGQVMAERGWRVLRSPGPSTTPFDPSFASADIFMGSHVDNDPNTEDRIEIFSTKPDPAGGGNLLLREQFVERQEGGFWPFSRKRTVVHHYASLIRSPGGIHLEHQLLSFCPTTGEIIDQRDGAEAIDKYLSKLEHDPGQHHPDPEPVPLAAPKPAPEPRADVTRLATALQHPTARHLKVEEERLEVGEREVPVRQD